MSALYTCEGRFANMHIVCSKWNTGSPKQGHRKLLAFERTDKNGIRDRKKNNNKEGRERVDCMGWGEVYSLLLLSHVCGLLYVYECVCL